MLEKCDCLIEYEKNLLVSALAAYKAELNDFLLKALGPKAILTGTAAGDEFHKLIGKRLTHIDGLIKNIENTPNCNCKGTTEAIGILDKPMVP